MDKYFICLANSYKRGGHCIAGIEIAFNANGEFSPIRNNDGRPRWIRPIAKTTHGEIPNYMAEDIKMFSIIKLSNVVPCPNKAHRENVYYSKLEQYECNLSFDDNIIKQFIDNKHQSIFYNRGRAVLAEQLMEINYSLMLIHAENAYAYIDENREKSKNRIKFSYYGSEYDFPITDPAFMEKLKRAPEKYMHINDVYLTLSLGLEFEGWHHKLVAGVIDTHIPCNSNQKTNTQASCQQDQLIWFDKYENELISLLDKKNEIEEKINDVRAKILQGMESHGLDKIHSKQISVNYTPPKTIMQFDSRAFRTENEELYSNYCKPKQREASIVVRRNVKD